MIRDLLIAHTREAYFRRLWNEAYGQVAEKVLAEHRSRFREIWYPTDGPLADPGELPVAFEMIILTDSFDRLVGKVPSFSPFMSDSQRLPWSRRCRSIGSTSRLESACSGAAGGFCERHVLPIGIAHGVIVSPWPPGTEQGDEHSLEQVSGVKCACSLVLLSAHPCTPAFPHACVDVASHVRYRVRLVMIRPGFAPGARRAFRVDFPCVKPFRIKQAALHPVCVCRALPACRESDSISAA